MIPDRIGRYSIQRQVGQGNTATVFQAFDLQDGRTLALKVARTDGDAQEQADWIAQLRQEQAILTSLEGVAIPKFYGYFETDGYHYNVLEYIDGDNLDTVLTAMQKPLPESEAIRWGLIACEILLRLHHHQPQPFICCCFGPDNFMLDHHGQFYMIDYGKVSPYRIDQEYPRLGVIGYAPPELYIGKPEPRSDIYGLGVLLYHATTRRDPRVKGAAFLFHVHPPRELNPALSAQFEAVILKAVEHKAVDRYHTIDELKVGLLACQ